MGTISEKLTYLNVTKQKLKQAINNIGGEVTDETTFRNYVAELENAYDRLPKTEFEEGESVTLENTLKGKLNFDDGKVGFGQASQESTQGYQLISLKDGTYTGNSGVTIKVENGKCTINGTPSASEVIPVQLKDNLSLTNGQTYTLYGFNDVANSNVAFRPRIDEGFFQVAFGTTNNVESKTYNGTSISVAYIGIRVGSGTTITNLVCKPMLISGNDTTKSYEPYTGGYASPSPNWEQQVKCVAGKNKFNINTQKENTIYNYTNKTWDTASNWNSSDYISVEQNSDYTLSFGSFDSGIQNYITFLDSKKDYISGGSGTAMGSLYRTVTTPINCKYIVFGYRNDKNPTNIMLEQGTQATPYLSFNTITETVRGENVYKAQAKTNGVSLIAMRCDWELNGDEFSLTATGNDMYLGEIIATGGSYLSNRGFKIYKNGNSKLSFRITNTLFNKNIFTAYDKNNISLGWTGINNDTGTYTFPDNCEYVTFRFGYGLATIGTTYKTKVMMAYGDTIPDYEPYKTPKTYQFSLGDHKFYGIGDYKDELIYDVDEDKVYKNARIGKAVLKSDMNWSRGGTAVSGKARYYTTYFTSIIKKPSSVSVVGDIMCNYYKAQVSASAGSYGGNQGIAIADTGTVYINDDNYADNLSGWTTWLDSVSCFFYYALDKEVQEEITGTLKDQVKAWYYGQSLDGTTIIEGNGDLPLLIEVRALKGE